MAEETNRWNVQRQESICDLRTCMKSVEPKDHSRLLHGDLWSGNVLTDQQGHPVFVDSCFLWESGTRYCNEPVIRWFPTGILDAYQTIFPLEKGWKDRLPITSYIIFWHI